MDEARIQSALADITAEKDPTLKSLKLASLCCALFRQRGVELILVGGSAIEAYTEGAYASGDIDLCVSNGVSMGVRRRQELMAPLKAEGGPRSWRVAGMYVDILGAVESQARTSRRELEAPYGPVRLLPPEELLVERVLVSVYPQTYPPAKDTARKLAAVALRGRLELDWAEVRRLANLPDFRVWPECRNVVKELCEEFGLQSPYHSDE